MSDGSNLDGSRTVHRNMKVRREQFTGGVPLGFPSAPASAAGPPFTALAPLAARVDKSMRQGSARVLLVGC